MSEMWSSLADRHYPEKPGLLSILQGKKTDKDWGLPDLAGKLCRGHGDTNKRIRRASDGWKRYLRSFRLRISRT